jgi:hypothetical protein
MAADDPAMVAVLDRLVPLTAEDRDWPRVLWLADLDVDTAPGLEAFRRLRKRRRRLLVAVIAIALVTVIPLVALAADGRLPFWSHDRKPAATVTPAGRPVVVASGDWNGTAWKLTALVSGQGTLVGPGGEIVSQPGVCLAVSSGAKNEAATPVDCAPIRGIAGNPGAADEGWISYVPALGAGLEAVAGAVADGVARVDVQLTDGRTLNPPLVRGDGIGGVRFYVAQAAPNQVVAVVAHGRSDEVLQTVVPS